MVRVAFGGLHFERCHCTVGFGGVNEQKSMGENLHSWLLRKCKILAVATGSWDLGQISSTMESTQSSARRPSRLTYKEASGMAATLSMLEDIGALHAALKISAENDKDQLL